MSRNPYPNDDGTPQLRPSVFVFMDILGYRQLSQEAQNAGNSERFLQTLHRALSKGRKWLEEPINDSVNGTLDETLAKDRYALKAFTDNIVMGWPIREDAESEFGDAFMNLALFQLDMVLSGFFIRGAISVHDAYIDEIAVSGNALIESLNAESSLARDPRVILTESAVSTVKSHLNYYHPPESAPQTRELLIDSDGQWFLNYLHVILMVEDEHGPFYAELEKHKRTVETQLDRYKNNPRVFSKYVWVAGYHNFFCDLHPQYHFDKYQIKTELFRAPPKLIGE